jgi:hypothetical protein
MRPALYLEKIMASLKCPNCGLVNSATEASCKRCQAPLAQGLQSAGALSPNVAPQYERGGQSYPPPADAYYPQTHTSSGAASPEDSYVFPPPPSTGVYPQGGVWRDEGKLVMSKDATLPDRCVKCNRPANGLRLKRTLYWHNPLIYALILAGVLIYLIVSLIVRKTATVNVPLCETHLAGRRNKLVAGSLLILLGLGAFIFTVAYNYPVLLVGAALIILIGLIFVIAAARVVIPLKIDDRFVWLKGVDKDYLNQLPQWAGLG